MNNHSRTLLILVLSLPLSLQVFAVEITLATSAEVPVVGSHPIHATELAEIDASTSSVQISWLGEDAVFFRVGPAAWRFRIASGDFEPAYLPEDFDSSLPVLSGPFKGNDFVVLANGDIWSGHKQVILGPEGQALHVAPSIGVGELTRKLPSKLEQPLRDDSTHWQMRLWGPYVVIPYPEVESLDLQSRFGWELYELSLRDFNRDRISPLVPATESTMNIGSARMGAVDFARFRVAVFVTVIERIGAEAPESVASIYLLDLQYDGVVLPETNMYREPSIDSEVMEADSGEQAVVVSSPRNYEVLADGSEDFWYLVSSGESSGWVHGRDLLIEGTTWSERLSERGPLVRWEELPALERELIEQAPADPDQQATTSGSAEAQTVGSSQPVLPDARPSDSVADRDRTALVPYFVALVLLVLLVGVVLSIRRGRRRTQ